MSTPENGFSPNFRVFLAGAMIIFIILAGLVGFSLGGARQPNVSPQAAIDAAVAATLAAQSTPTLAPSPTWPPAPTPVSLTGLFCEYEFCIGHPAEIYLVDISTIRNPASPSTRAYGVLVGFNPSLYIQVIWSISNPNYDPQLTMRLILEEQEQPLGALEALRVGEINVFYQPINTMTEKLPHGGAASWQCNGRDFAWKAYAPAQEVIPALLRQALERFRCE